MTDSRMSDDRPLCIDLFCGRGGWARGFLDAGYRVVGFDIEDMSKWYPGEFHQADLGNAFSFDMPTVPQVIVASPPCDTLTDVPWHRKEPDFTLWGRALWLITRYHPEWWCIENVRGAQRFFGKAVCHRGSRYLWGNFPIFSMSRPYGKWRLPPSPDRKALRSLIPYPIARALAEACKP